MGVVQVRIEHVTPGMRIGLTQVVTKVQPVGGDEYLLETRLVDTEDLGIPPLQRTYPRGFLISIDDRKV